MVVGIVFAVHQGRAFKFVITQYSIDIIFVLLFILYIDTLEKLEKTIFMLCASAFFYAAMSLANSAGITGRFAFGTMYDPNDLAQFLVALLPFNFLFMYSRRPMFQKILLITTVGLSIGVTLMTGSRGGLLGLSVVLLILFMTKLGLQKKKHKIYFLSVIAAVLVIAIGSIDTERYETLMNVEEDYNVTSESGRVTIWKRGLVLAMRNPITGVGASCFPLALTDLRMELGVPPLWQNAHNIFLQFLAENGIIAFALYVMVIGSAVRIFYSNGRSQNTSDRQERLKKASSIVLVSFCGFLTCSLFLSQAYSVFMILYFSLSVIIPQIIEKELQDEAVDRENIDTENPINDGQGRSGLSLPG